jgi:hypothetical protein
MKSCDHDFLTSCWIKSIKNEELTFINISNICHRCGAVNCDIKIQFNNTKENYELAHKIGDGISIVKRHEQSINDVLRQYLKGKTYFHNQKSGFPFNK